MMNSNMEEKYSGRKLAERMFGLCNNSDHKDVKELPIEPLGEDIPDDLEDDWEYDWDE